MEISTWPVFYPVMKIILYNRQLSDGDFLYGNSHREKKKSVFQAACECLIRLRLQTKRKKHYTGNCCA